jgi:hypothetical protein
MKNYNWRIIFLFVVAALTGFYWGQGSVSTTNQDSSALIAVDKVKTLIKDDRPFVADNRLKESGCFVNGSYPDHECTPGAVFADVTAEQTCVSGYTKTVRSVSVKLKKEVYAEYSIAYPPPFGSYEADHFVPLALGGNNDIANLFPEAAGPKPGFRDKDLVENYLHEQVCAGKISLAAAQRAIVTDWVAVYKSMPPSDIARLKAKYADWSKSGD